MMCWCLYNEKKYFLLLFNWVWLKLLPVFRSKRGLEIYSGSLNLTRYLWSLIVMGAADGGKYAEVLLLLPLVVL